MERQLRHTILIHLAELLAPQGPYTPRLLICSQLLALTALASAMGCGATKATEAQPNQQDQDPPAPATPGALAVANDVPQSSQAQHQEGSWYLVRANACGFDHSLGY